MRRVAVTGLGVICPLGRNLREIWPRLIEGQSGIVALDSEEFNGFPVQIGGKVPDFNMEDFMDSKEISRSQRFVHFAVAATKHALEDSGLDLTDALKRETGTSIGVGVGGLGFMEQNTLAMAQKGHRGVSPFTIPGFIVNMAAGIVSMQVGARGPNLCTATACTSGTHAIGEAALMIQTGRAKVMIAGGSESALTKLGFAGFSRMKALCQDSNDRPEAASRPFDKTRSGFVMGEGAGILILEELEFAKKRGARVYAELRGFGLSGDAYHMTAQAPGGEGAIQAMKQALDTGGLNPSEIDYINAHGTSTQINDATESEAIKKLFQQHSKELVVSSTKSMTGHLLGAAGGVEAAFTVKSLSEGIIPPTINLNTPDPDCDLNYSAHTATEKPITSAISNSFGFGGTNGCLAFKKLEG